MPKPITASGLVAGGSGAGGDAGGGGGGGGGTGGGGAGGGDGGGGGGDGGGGDGGGGDGGGAGGLGGGAGGGGGLGAGPTVLVADALATTVTPELAPLADTDAVFVTVLATSGRTTIVSAEVMLTGMSSILQTTVAVPVQVPSSAVAETYVTSAGRTSVNVTSRSVSGPRFCTANAYVSRPPTTGSREAAFVITSCPSAAPTAPAAASTLALARTAAAAARNSSRIGTA